jgi:hypothetical protein
MKKSNKKQVFVSFRDPRPSSGIRRVGFADIESAGRAMLAWEKNVAGGTASIDTEGAAIAPEDESHG